MGQVTKILQLTDLHLFGDQQTKLVGVNPFQSLQQVIAKILDDADKNLPDLLVLTGDVSQDYSLASYKTAAKALEIFQCQIAVTMGNHDHLSLFTKVFCDPIRVVDVTNTNWRIIMLNTHFPNYNGGQLADNELAFLQENLATSSNQPVIIFLHHHILSVGSNWLDKIKLRNNSQFLEIIDQYQNIKAVVCGHTHQDTVFSRQNVTFMTTPATSWQFVVASFNFKLDTLMPGYRWINLYEDGTIQTKVVRIAHNDTFVPDINSKGY